MTQLLLPLYRRTAQGIPLYQSRDFQSLYDFQGLGIKVVREKPRLEERIVVGTPKDLLPLMEELYKGQEKEIFFSLLLDGRNHLEAVDMISIGTLNASLVHPRETYRLAIILSAASIITMHNHPSGDPTPSREDIELAKRLADAGEIVGITMLDSLIFGGGGRYLSMKESNLF